jgi:hypothetical protein
MSETTAPSLRGFAVTVDADAVRYLVEQALADLQGSGRYCDLRALAGYMDLYTLLHRCVTIEASEPDRAIS